MVKLAIALFLIFLHLPISAQFVEDGQGVVKGSMTVQGNAFSVGGSSFAVIGSSVGVRTTSPAAALDVSGSVQIGSGTAKSTFTASGQLKLNAFGIQWADGTTSTTSASTGFQAVSAATAAVTSQNTTTNTSWTSVAGATVTLTANGNRLFMHFACDITQASSGYRSYGGFLLNGALFDGQTTSTGFTTATTSGGPASQLSGQWQHLTADTYSGSVSIVPVFKTEAGGTAWVDAYGDSACQMAVWEVQ